MFDLGTLAPQIQTFFTQTADLFARTTGLVKRRSKLTGALFFQSMIFGFLDTPDASLTDLTETCDALGISIRKQGLQNRIEVAALFLQQMFQQAMALFRHTLPLELPLLEQFSAIFLTDSTTVALPDVLCTEYPGCGGDGPNAALKIQLTFDFLHGAIQGLALQTGRSPDQSYLPEPAAIVPNAVYLSDLGYFALARFQLLQAHGAYFLSRFDTQTTLTTTTGETLDLLPWLRTHTESTFEQEVCIGSHLALPCRLVAVRVPQEVADLRRRKALAATRRKGRHLPSERHLALMDWTLYITNLTSAQLSLRQVVVLYTVRWQIELLFKVWKSQCAVARVSGWQRPRVLSELYAKLIGFVVIQFLLTPYRKGERELSVGKVVRLLQHHLSHLIESLADLENFTANLQALALRFQQNGLKDKRVKRQTTLQTLRITEETLA